MKVFNPQKQKVADFRYAHLKRDGHQIIVQKNDLGTVKCYSKNYNLKDLSWHPIWHSLVQRVPCDTELHCELWAPGKPAAYISSGLVQRDTGMILECFAVPTLRYGLPLANVMLECNRWQVPFIPFYDQLGEPLSSGRGPMWQADIKKWKLDPDSEGFVLKNSNGSEPYKWKPFLSADLRVTGVNTEGKGKHAGLIGALICSLDLHNNTKQEVANVSGMTDVERMQMTVMHQKGILVGKICEVRYQYVNSQGRLRHASFVRFRDDKDTADYELE